MQQPKQKILSEWIDLYSSKLLHWAKVKCGDDSLAEDLVQDTFLVAFEKIDTFKEKSQPITWLFGILNNKINDNFRKQSRMGIDSIDAEESSNGVFNENGFWTKNQTFFEWSNESHLLDNLEFLKVFQMCLDNLPMNWRDALLQKYIFGKDSKEICQVLEINDTNYWQIIHRAKLLVRNCIQKNWVE